MKMGPEDTSCEIGHTVRKAKDTPHPMSHFQYDANGRARTNEKADPMCLGYLGATSLMPPPKTNLPRNVTLNDLGNGGACLL